MKPSSPAGSPPTPDLVPGIADILRFFSGAGLLMAGRMEGLRRLDLSADGFWQSFSAILVAAPPIALSWLEYERMENDLPQPELGSFAIYGAHALADLLSWMLPVLVLMLLARPIGYSRKIVPLVVATNWGGALLAWAFAPYWLLLMLFGADGLVGGLGVLVTLASLFLTGRLVHMAVGRDVGAAIAVTMLMVVASLVCYGAVMDVTGVRLIR